MDDDSKTEELDKLDKLAETLAREFWPGPNVLYNEQQNLPYDVTSRLQREIRALSVTEFRKLRDDMARAKADAYKRGVALDKALGFLNHTVNQ